MFKPTLSLQKTLRRLPLSTKQAGKEYYKGNGVGSMGSIDRYGRFSPDWNKIRTFVYPTYGTKKSDLTPFVAQTMEKTTQDAQGLSMNYAKRFTGEEYLRKWKLNGGYDQVVQDSGKDIRMPTPFEERPAK